MADLYPKGADQLVGDDEWIADVSARGWVALTKDVSIIRDLHRILQRSRKCGPYVDVVHKDRIERRWPSTGVAR